MGSYHYRARDLKGALVSGQIAAEDLKSAKRQIALRGLILLTVKESQVFELYFKVKESFKPKVSIEDLVMFSRQMQLIYSVGIPILKGMELVLEQATHPLLKQAVIEITKDLSEGKTLHEAMAKHGTIFDPIYINLVRVGETTGGLETMLERASQLIEERAELSAKLKSATFYPRLVVGFFSIVFLIIVYGILPKLKTFFTNLGSDLPLITRTVMGVSDFFVSYWFILAAVLGACIWSVRKLLSIPKYKMAFDRKLFKLPIFGLLLQQVEVNTFCIILDILLRSGVAVVESLKYVEASSTNVAFALDIANCRETIQQGGTLAKGIESASTFPVLIKGLISMGEEGGKLPQVLQQISSFYKIQINHRINNLSKLIEPILLFFIFGLVLILALAVFMPMWKMSSAIKH